MIKAVVYSLGFDDQAIRKWVTRTGAAAGKQFFRKAHSLGTYNQARFPRRRDRVDWRVLLFAPFDYI